MACHRFTDAIRAGALGAALDADAAAHLAVCSDCQAVFETEDRVMAAIDVALEGLASATPSSHFASRVRAHVAQAPRRWTPASWWMPATVAALALLVSAVVVSRMPVERLPAREAPRSRPVEGSGVAAAERAGDRATNGARVETKRSTRVRRRAVPEPARVAQAPEILVPGQRRQAVSRLFASLRAGRPEVVSMLMNLHGGQAPGAGDGLTIEPLHIEPVVISAMPSSAPIVDK